MGIVLSVNLKKMYNYCVNSHGHGFIILLQGKY